MNQETQGLGMIVRLLAQVLGNACSQQEASIQLLQNASQQLKAQSEALQVKDAVIAELEKKLAAVPTKAE